MSTHLNLDVYITPSVGLAPWNTTHRLPRLWVNPWAERLFDVPVPWATTSVNLGSGVIEPSEAGVAFDELFSPA